MKILLVNLPWSENGRLGVRAGSRWPFTAEPEQDGRIHYIPFPFFLAYATSLLKKNSFEAKLIDAVAEGLGQQHFLERVNSFRPDLIVAETSTPSFDNDIRLLRTIHQHNPNITTALCGPHASAYPKEILAEYAHIDVVLEGEYEYTLLDFCRSFERKDHITSIPGLAYRKKATAIRNKPRPRLPSLNSLPWPERDDVPLYNYNDAFCSMPRPNVQMMSSRGCVFRCTFCLWPQTMYGNRRYRRRDPADVIREMDYLIRQYKFAAVYFDDDVFNISRSHVLQMCAEIKKHKLAIPWGAMARADLMDEELIASCADTGMYAIKYGLESADNLILRHCKKNMNIEKAKRMILLTKRYGVKTHLTFCVGLPQENEATIEATLRFIDGVRPDSLQCSLATPFPGTAYFSYLEDHKLLISKRWADYDGNYQSVVKSHVFDQHALEAFKRAIEQRLGVVKFSPIIR